MHEYPSIKKLCIKGFSEREEHIIYNLDFIIESITIETYRNADFFFNQSTVKNELIKKIIYVNSNTKK